MKFSSLTDSTPSRVQKAPNKSPTPGEKTCLYLISTFVKKKSTKHYIYFYYYWLLLELEHKILLVNLG